MGMFIYRVCRYYMAYATIRVAATCNIGEYEDVSNTYQATSDA